MDSWTFKTHHRLAGNADPSPVRGSLCPLTIRFVKKLNKTEPIFKPTTPTLLEIRVFNSVPHKMVMFVPKNIAIYKGGNTTQRIKIQWETFLAKNCTTNMICIF